MLMLLENLLDEGLLDFSEYIDTVNLIKKDYNIE